MNFNGIILQLYALYAIILHASTWNYIAIICIICNYIANILQLYCNYIAIILQLYCNYMHYTQLYCKYIAYVYYPVKGN